MGWDEAFDTGLAKLRSGNFRQPGPYRGRGRGAGRPWSGLVEETPAIWVGWLVAFARLAGKPLPRAILIGDARVDITTARLTYGQRHYFRCPRCGRRCEAVYILARVPACRKCHHLGFRSQAQRASSIWAVLDVMFDRRAFGTRPKRYDVDKDLLAGLLAEVRADLGARLARALDGVTVATVEEEG